MQPATSQTITATAVPDGSSLLVRRLVLFVLAAVGLLLIGECALYLSLDLYLDHIEGNIAISAWDYAHGVALYELQAGAPRFANIYGPLAFLAPLPGLFALGPSVFASKVTGPILLLLTIAVMGWWFRRNGTRETTASMLFLVAGLAAMNPWSFWTRPDPLEAFLLAAAIAVSAYPALVGVCIGLAVGCKIHAFVYFFPIVLELLVCRRIVPLLVLAACAGVTTAAPFLLPGISAHDYLAILFQQVAGRPHIWGEPEEWLSYTAALALPIGFGLAANGVAARDRIYAIATLVSLAAVLYLVTYPGAGHHHLLPLVPLLAAARHRLPAAAPLASAALLPIIVLGLTMTHSCVVSLMDWRGEGAVADEAVHLVKTSPVQPADLGYGEAEPSYKITQLAKAKLDFAGRPPTLDAQVLMELSASGIDASRRWIPIIEHCQVRRWIIPKGEQPFATGSYYVDTRLFNEDFRRTFTTRYRIVGESDHFSIWGCDPEPR